MMKKLFTSILMLSVALCSWGVSVKSFSGGVLTLESNGVSFSNFVGSQDDLSNSTWNGQVTRLVLIGDDFTNADFDDSKGGKMTNFIKACAGNGKKLYLDLEGCTGVISLVEYTGSENEPNYASMDFKLVPSQDNPVTLNYTVNDAQKDKKYIYYENQWYQIDYTNDVKNGILVKDANGNWLRNGNIVTGNQCPNREIDIYVDGNGNEIIGDNISATGNTDNPGTYTVTYSKTISDRFTLGVNDGGCKGSLSGVTFPNHSYFTAIPDNLCYDSKCDLQTVVLSFEEGNNGKTDYITWIGKNAFRFDPAYTIETVVIDGVQVEKPETFQATKKSLLANVTLPKSLKVIDVDAFYGCTAFTSVDLSRPTALVRVDAAAFNMVRTELNNLNSVTLPGTEGEGNHNTSLKFFANQVFSSSHITTLDFQYCDGITNFAYDGQNTFGESSYTSTNHGSSATFAWYASLVTLKLPPYLKYVPGDSGNSGDENKSFVANCKSLKNVIFTGSAQYNNDCELPENNQLIIEYSAFANCTTLESVTLSNNVTEIREHAFEKTAIECIRIPASVEVIQKNAFNLCDKLTTVIFEDVDPNCKCGTTTNTPDGAQTHIVGDPNGGNGGTSASGAFYNCPNIQDVYVNNTHQELKCDNYAFNYAITWGHANVQAKFATLHFPKQFAENYANLSHPLTDDIAADPGKFHNWLHTHIRKAVDPNGNGWHEFINAGPYTGNIDDPDNVCQEIILRTFSDYSYSYIVPDGLRAYVVKEIDANATIPTVTLQRIFVIPARTGVILYGHPNGKNTNGEPVLSLTPVEFAEEGETLDDGTIATYNHGKALCRANWNDPSNAHAKNYLEPTSTPTAADVEVINNRIARLQKQLQNTTDEAEIQLITKKIQHANADKTETLSLMDQHKDDWKNGGMYVKPFNNQTDVWNVVDTKTTNPVTFRNFGMGRYSKTEESTFRKVPLGANDTDYEAFFRLVPGWFANGKAYLRLKANNNEYDLATGAEIIVKKDEGQGVAVPYYYEYDKSNPGATINYRDNDHLGSVANNPKHWWDNREQYGFTWEVVDLTGDKHDGRILKNWGERPANFQNKPNFIPTYLGELGEDADGIVKLAIPSEYFNVDNDYYTLQGVKVTNPTKGVYIRNGKKVIIK